VEDWMYYIDRRQRHGRSLFAGDKYGKTMN